MPTPTPQASELPSSVGLVAGQSADKDAAERFSNVKAVYDWIAPYYSVSSRLFHTTAHDCALRLSGIRDGSRVLEVAIGTGELFRKLIARNPAGHTVGVDFSTEMAARTLRAATAKAPDARSSCSSSDARSLPFADGSFDTVFVCFLLELLPPGGAVGALEEFRRVLAPDGRLALVLTGQDRNYFNAIYEQCTRYAPSVWGRQIEREVPALMRNLDLKIVQEERTLQNGVPARVLVAQSSRV